MEDSSVQIVVLFWQYSKRLTLLPSLPNHKRYNTLVTHVPVAKVVPDDLAISVASEHAKWCEAKVYAVNTLATIQNEAAMSDARHVAYM